MGKNHYYVDEYGMTRMKEPTARQRKGYAKYLRRQGNSATAVSSKRKHGRQTKVSPKGVASDNRG